VLGIVENMSYAVCPDCGAHHEIFGPSRVGELAESIGAPLLGRLPIEPGLAELADSGRLEEAETNAFGIVASAVVEQLPA